MKRNKPSRGRGLIPKLKSPKLNTNNFSLGDILELQELHSGIIRLNTSIDYYVAEDLERRVKYLQQMGFRKITILITSPGGSVYHSLALYDKLVDFQKQGVELEAVVEGFAASAASMVILQAFKKRKSLANARFLLHEPRRFVMFAQERTSDIKDESKEMNILSDMIYDIIAKRCKKSKGEIEEFVERKEVWLSAREAMDFGLIDEII